MAEYKAVVAWVRDGAVSPTIPLAEAIAGSLTAALSCLRPPPRMSSLPLSVAAAVDPEEAFVPGLSSCHMLWFPSIAAKRGFVVDSHRTRRWAGWQGHGRQAGDDAHDPSTRGPL